MVDVKYENEYTLEKEKYFRKFLSENIFSVQRKKYTGNISEFYKKNSEDSKYSHSGEEGLIWAIIRDLKIENGYFCDFGAGNGKTCSASYSLVNELWIGISIERSIDLFKRLKMTYLDHKYGENNVLPIYGSMIGDLDDMLNRKGIQRLDVLFLNTNDGYDIWKSLKIKPKIVSIKYNSYRDPVCHEFMDSKDFPFDILDKVFKDVKRVRVSFRPIVELGLSKGYIPVACAHVIIFVRSDLVKNLSFPIVESSESRDYLYLYPTAYYSPGTSGWYTNDLMRYNTAVRDDYLETGEYLNFPNIEKRLKEI